MKCPACPDDTLVMTERSGIEIDYCPACRGVWLDRGELDKIIDRSVAPTSPAPAQSMGTVPDRSSDNRPRHDDRSSRPSFDDRSDRFEDSRRHDRDDDRFNDRFDGDERGGRRPKRRRESLLGELFDF